MPKQPFKPYTRYRLDYPSDTSGLRATPRKVLAEVNIGDDTVVVYRHDKDYIALTRREFFKSYPYASLEQAQAGYKKHVQRYIDDELRRQKHRMRYAEQKRKDQEKEHLVLIRRLRRALAVQHC